jgi:pyruvate/2-oxoglutarate dehydrogenase complex dihydrolipoamide dehydrogenase (E3) component/uncharacterized membrane protein YdjX (TVP38/TMEM64 family)
MIDTFDVVVIGAGSAGLSAAVGLSKIGKRVLLVESEQMGGECTNSGCIPSKALIHHARAYYHAQKIAGQTEASEEFRKKAFSYTQTIISEILAEETPAHFKKLGIEVLFGAAHFSGPTKIIVNDKTYYFKKAIIATGSSPRPLFISGLNESSTLTNQNIFKLSDIPEKILIIGSGPIGLELGQALAMLGSQVTIASTDSEFAYLEDEAIRPILKKSFDELGIKIELNAYINRAEGNVAFLDIKDGDKIIGEKHVYFNKILVAIGRVPNIPEGLNEAGVTAFPYGIKVNKNWQTDNKNIYAIGDVASSFKFTHAADDTARQIVTHIATHGLISVKEKTIPKVIYTKPEVAQVGLSHPQAREEYGNDKIIRLEIPFAHNDRPKTDGEKAGLLIIIAKRLSGKILGVHIIGAQAGELICTVTLAMEQNISLYKIHSTVFAYPTYSLILKKASDKFLAEQFYLLKSDLVLLAKLLLPRLIIIATWAAGLTWLYYFKTDKNLSLSDVSLSLLNFISSTAWGPLLYIFAYALRPLTFLPGTILTVLSGVFFGLWGGIIYTIIGANLSAIIAYLVGKYFSKKTNNTKTTLGRWTDSLRHNPFMTILTMRLTFMPFDMVNYGAGLFRVSFTAYLLATIIGTLLGIVTFVAIGASLSIDEFVKNGITKEAIETKFIIFSIIIFFVSLLFSKLIKNKNR